MLRIRIVWDNVEMLAALNDSPTAYQLWDALPTDSTSQTGEDQVYFEVPLDAVVDEGARETVDSGTLCYWVEASAVAIPFNSRQITDEESDEEDPQTVNVIGTIEGDPKMLESVAEGSVVRVERVGE